MSAWSGGGSKGKPQAKGKGPSWLGSGAGKGPRKPGPMWKPTAQRQVDPEARQRAIRTTVAVAAVILLAGFLYYLLTRPEPTPVIALRATAYPLQMPPLSFAEEDVALLSKISPHNVRVLPVELSSSAKALDDFRKTLQVVGRQFNIFRRGAATVIVHVTAHGVVNESGEACLVPPAADPFDTRTWLPVSQLLGAVREEPSLKGKKKLVLLDCQRAASCWRCGWLENRFADELSSTVKSLEDPTLFVIASAAPGQTGLTAPELRGSVFGHFVARGLKGEASSGGRSVSLTELFRYVAEQTNDYAQRRRGAAQQPLLLYANHVFRADNKGKLVALQGQGDSFEDFTLAYVDRWQKQHKLEALQGDFDPLAAARRILGGRSPAKSEAAGESSGTTLQPVWELYRKRRQPSAVGPGRALPGYVYDPVAWSSIQQRLAAIGERILAGQQYQGPALQTEIDKLAKELADDQQWTLKADLPKLDLLQVASGERGAGGENLFEVYWKTERAKRRESLPRNATLTRVVSDLYQSLSDPAHSAEARQRLAVAAEFLSLVSSPERSSELIESHFITLLDRGLSASGLFAAEDLSTGLKSRQVAEQSANPIDVRAHYLVESLVNAADEKRRQAEDQFFLGTDARLQQRLWSEATGDGNSAGYQAAIRRGQAIAAMLALRDEIWSDLPLIAEFHFARSGAAAQSRPIAGLAALYEQSIELDDALERLLRSRDEEGAFAARFERCQKAYDSLAQRWPGMRGELEGVYELPTNVEQAYRRAVYVHDAELALRLPPLNASSSQFVERYLQTLEGWVNEGLPATQSVGEVSSSRPTDGDGALSASPTSSSSSVVDQRAYLRELHRVLSYEFVDPYEQHRHATPWDEQATTADTIFRGEGPDSTSAWKRLQKLLDAYNDAIAQESPAWSAAQRAVAAATRLRQWDRRVRVAGHWLSSFQPDLRRPTQPTPARWLQQYDVAHLTAWHAYRAKGDFLGNGKLSDADAPFFAQAIDRCTAVMPQAMRPMQYDAPGGSMADFSEDAPTALAALRQWDPIQFPRSLNLSSSAGDAKIDIAIQPAEDGGKELRLPPGTATLSFAAPSDAGEVVPRLSFDAGGKEPTKAVKLPLVDRSPLLVTAYVDRSTSGQTGAGSAAVEARLWYRGHVRSKPCPVGPGAPQFIQYEFVRPNYPPPTVEVQGKDTIRGAVLFIFDCSASMRWSMDGRFRDAKRELNDVLEDLEKNAGDSLRVGLWVYGRRTPAGEDRSKFLYDARQRYDSANNLTELGRQLSQQLGAQAFQSRYPHPDRDVEELSPVATGTAADAARALANVTVDQCQGSTPLYYAIQQAAEHGFDRVPKEVGPLKQVVVITDGVNMPFSGLNLGRSVNNEDLSTLEKTLTRHRQDIRASVVLFGGKPTDPDEKAQFDSLTNTAARYPNFVLLSVPRAADIARTIRESFPKTMIELRSNQSNAAPQILAFNQPQEVKDWGADGLLHRELERRTVRLKLPGEERSLDQDIDLLGGERVVLQYNARETQLTFADDGLIRRGSGAAQPPRIADARKLFVDALDPERVGATINRFHFRIRDDDAQRRFAPRPKYVWLELKPRGIGGEAADYVFPCIDAAWKENVNLPRLQVPVERWPDCPTARAQVWFRYSDPQALQQATIPRDQSGQTLSVGAEKWRIEQAGGEAGAARKITVTWQPTEPQPGVDKLLERAVWLWPPPDLTRRFYTLDGTAAIHEFTYSRPETANVDVQLRVVSRTAFQQGAYFAECEFDVAN
jgi:hypothetical protein